MDIVPVPRWQHQLCNKRMARPTPEQLKRIRLIKGRMITVALDKELNEALEARCLATDTSKRSTETSSGRRGI